MRVAIVGQKWLGARVLDLCVTRGDDIAVVIHPPAGEKKDRLHRAAEALGLPTLAARRRVTDGAIPPGVDVIIAAHAHVFISAAARSAARLGALGYHPSLLPRHRGRDAVAWAIKMGDKTTGGSVYWMDDGADTGPIAAQAWCHIRPDDTAATLWRRELAPMGLSIFGRVLADIDRGRIIRVEQDEELATWEPSLSRPPLSNN